MPIKLMKKSRMVKVPLSQRYIYHAQSEEIPELQTCSVCGESMDPENLYICSECGRVYCRSCAQYTIGGPACPECSDLIFLKRIQTA
jgi:DNA-directed RNA polymerase subunit RPC12/RpoP